MNPKIIVCIPTSIERDKYYQELRESLNNQTYKDFMVITVSDITPIGNAKHLLVNLALKEKADYICMIDDDDLVEPTYIEEIAKRFAEAPGIDWCFTWGKLFGDRTGFIHGSIEPYEELLKSNGHRHSWINASAKVFEKVNYDPKIDWAEDWDLWQRLDEAKFRGAVIQKELYLKRWHNSNLTITHKKQHYRFHIPAYVHLPVSEKYMGCAFTQKIVKLSKMLMAQGHEVFIYGAEGSDVPCTEFIQTHTLADIAQEWGDGDNRFEIGYDYKNGQFRHDFNSEKTPTTLKFYIKCIAEISKRKRDDDFLLIMQGKYHKPIYETLKMYLTCEPGIGYRGSDPKNWRAFESHYLQSFTYGSEHPFESVNGSYYDRVIPNYFDKKDFNFRDKKDDYYLYIGRMIERKGVMTAVKATEAIGAKLILVGQKDDEIDVDELPKHCEFRGFADIVERKKLMAGAIAVFTPTIYLEAFAGTHIEAMLSGTPPITTNFGVFPGTIPDEVDGKVGFRCNTLQDFVDAAIKAKKVNHNRIRQYANRFLMEHVALEFEKWWSDLYQVYLSTKDKNVKGWHYLQK